MHKVFKAGMLSFLVSVAASAATITFDFTTSGGTLGGPSPFGDTRKYTSGTNTVTASAFSLPSNPSGNFIPGQLNQYSGLGLAVCNNTGEGANCSNPEHQVDNNGSYDFVLFTFNGTVDPASIVINPYGVFDRDVTYWVGTLNSSLSGFNLGNMNLGARMDDDSTPSDNSRPVTLGGGTGNVLLIGARLSGNDGTHGNADGSIDRFKIESLTVNTVTTPEPATFGLAGFALVGLGLLRRRKN